MLSAALLACGLALLIVPARRPARRLRALLARRTRPASPAPSGGGLAPEARGAHRAHPASLALPGLPAGWAGAGSGATIAAAATGLLVPGFLVLGLLVLGFLLLGPAGAVVAGMVGALGWRQWREWCRTKAARATLQDFSAALATMIAQLRAGAHPATAAETAAEDASGGATQVGAALRGLAACARLGGDDADIGATLRAEVERSPVLGSPLMALTRAWTLAGRHGLPLAETLEPVRRDIDAGARLTAAVQSRMAGPRTSAAVLAALPLLGVGLGQLMGANPLTVLSSTASGQVLLLLGAGLACAGVLWSAHLTRQEPPSQQAPSQQTPSQQARPGEGRSREKRTQGVPS